MSRQRIVLATAAGIASALLLAACGASTNSASSTSPGAVVPVTSSAAPAGGDMVTTAMLMAKQTTDGMGTIVTDDKGWTLYRYEKDQASPSMSMCTDDCAKTWMPVMAQDSTQVDGVEQSLVGSVARSDGMKQLTLAGWPLYRYMGDTKAGDMKGQAKDNMWYAVTPAGKKAGTSSEASSAMPSMSGMS